MKDTPRLRGLSVAASLVVNHPQEEKNAYHERTVAGVGKPRKEKGCPLAGPRISDIGEGVYDGGIAGGSAK